MILNKKDYNMIIYNNLILKEKEYAIPSGYITSFFIH